MSTDRKYNGWTVEELKAELERAMQEDFEQDLNGDLSFHTAIAAFIEAHEVVAK